MNKVILMGRLVKDPNVMYTTGEKATAVARYTLAVDKKRRQEGKPTADFINCVAFGKNAVFAEKYLHKGIKIVITGSLQTGSYVNKEGQTVYTTDVMIEEQYFAESKSANTKNNAEPQITGNEDFMKMPEGTEEELPFN